MSGLTAVAAEIDTVWRVVCGRNDLVPDSGVVALLGGVQVALFYLPDEPGGSRVFAVDNRDPRSGANVIGRGLVCNLANQLVVAAPLYKQHFRLEDGVCLETPGERLRVWPARLRGDDVEVGERVGYSHA